MSTNTQLRRCAQCGLPTTAVDTPLCALCYRGGTTNRIAAEQTNAAFREAVERRAALRAAAQPEQLPPSSLCRLCGEPLALLEMREQLCAECESDENERMSQEYEAERAADAPYHGRR